MGDFPYVGKVDGLVLLVVSVVLLVSGVQAQPTTLIPANEGVATLANTTWKSNADFLHEVRQIREITKVKRRDS